MGALSGSLLQPQGLAHSTCSINICGMTGVFNHFAGSLLKLEKKVVVGAGAVVREEALLWKVGLG